MSKHIPVPPELQHLLEKRESEEDRRKSAKIAKNAPASGTERRKRPDRRRKRKSSN